MGRVQREYGCLRLCGILFVMIRLTLGRTSEGEVVGVGVLSIELAVCCGWTGVWVGAVGVVIGRAVMGVSVCGGGSTSGSGGV